MRKCRRQTCSPSRPRVISPASLITLSCSRLMQPGQLQPTGFQNFFENGTSPAPVSSGGVAAQAGHAARRHRHGGLAHQPHHNGASATASPKPDQTPGPVARSHPKCAHPPNNAESVSCQGTPRKPSHPAAHRPQGNFYRPPWRYAGDGDCSTPVLLPRAVAPGLGSAYVQTTRRRGENTKSNKQPYLRFQRLCSPRLARRFPRGAEHRRKSGRFPARSIWCRAARHSDGPDFREAYRAPAAAGRGARRLSLFPLWRQQGGRVVGEAPPQNPAPAILSDSPPPPHRLRHHTANNWAICAGSISAAATFGNRVAGKAHHHPRSQQA